MSACDAVCCLLELGGIMSVSHRAHSLYDCVVTGRIESALRCDVTYYVAESRLHVLVFCVFRKETVVSSGQIPVRRCLVGASCRQRA